MSNLGENPVVITIPDTDTMTGLQCFDAADHMDKEFNPEAISNMYATGATKLTDQYCTDPDAYERALVADSNTRYPLVDCPEGSDNLKRFKTYKRALQRAGDKAFPVENKETGNTYDGKVVITFNSPKLKKGETDARKRTVKVEIVTAVQVQVLADQAVESAELAKKQKKDKADLKEKQEAAQRGTASASDQLKVLRQYMAEQFGMAKEREVISLWLADINSDLDDDIGDTDTVDLSPLTALAS